MSELSRYELLTSIATRRRQMETIEENITQLEKRITKLKEQKEELKTLNFLDEILIKELYNGID